MFYNLINWIYTFGIFASFYKGYENYTQVHDGMAVCWAALCAFCVMRLFSRIYRSRYYRMRLDQIDCLDGRAFERYLELQFRRMGYQVDTTDDSHDYGADLILHKRKETIVVQAKRYDRNVGLAAVQEVVGAIAYYEADRGMVVTNSHFTASAKNLARQNEVELWGREELVKRFHIPE